MDAGVRKIICENEWTTPVGAIVRVAHKQKRDDIFIARCKPI